MSDQDLPEGAFLTSLNGRQCTAVPRTDGEAATTSAADVATPTAAAESTAESTAEAASPPPAAGGAGNESDGGDVATIADAAATPSVGGQTDIGAAASTANSSPGVDSTSEAPSSSPAQTLAQEAGAAEQTLAQAEEISAPSDPPPSSLQTQPPTLEQQDPVPPPPPPPPIEDPVQGQQNPTSSPLSIQDSIQEEQQEPPPSSPADAPQIAQTPQTSEQSQTPSPENSSTNSSAAPTTPPVNVNNAGDQSEEPVLTPVPPQDTQDTTSTPGLNGASAEDSQGEVSDGSGGNMPSTAVLAGSIAGGVALVSIIAFLLWFWRKKAINKRRSSLLTPLTIPTGAGGGKGGGAVKEKNASAYVIDRESLGPTPMGQKFRAAVGANFKRFRDRDDSTVDLNRGPSQYGARDGSSRGEVVTGKDRFKDWWERLTADVNFNWKLRNEGGADPDPAAAARDIRERGVGANSSQPDFLTLLGMDDKEVQREAAKRQAGHTKGGSSGSDHFLGGLGLNFDSSSGNGNKENPFSDINALSHDSAKPAPLAVTPDRTAANPFSDDNAVRGPATYVADVRRSRGQPGGKEPYRESVQSDAEPRRTKFRSDPFDLERPELLGSRQDLTMTSAGGEDVGRPRRAHTREDSFSSKYSSGFSLGDWSDPGPDVGPGGARWDPNIRGSRSGGGGGVGGVGKAL